MAAARTRKAFHAVQFSEEEAAAYKAVRADFIAIRTKAAHNLQRLREEENDLPRREVDVPERRQAALRAHEHLREVALLGPIDLSEPAVGVIREYLAQLEREDISESDGGYYADAAWSAQYLRDFTERRKVDLGQMSEVRWRVGRWKCAVASKLKTWQRRWQFAQAERRARQKSRGGRRPPTEPQ